MTEANQKKLYNHFIKTGKLKEAKFFLVRYPHFETKTIVEAKKNKKSKGKY